MKKDVIRVGDRVEIIAPVRFLRCGYDLNYQEVKSKILDSEIDLLQKVALKYAEEKLSKELRNSFLDKVAYGRLAGAFAHALVSLNIRNNSKRKLFLEPMIDLKDPLRLWQMPRKGEKATVQKIKYVKTGRFVKGGGGYDPWSGEWDYEPSYLSDEKTHKVLDLEFDSGYRNEKVLAIHVRKLRDENT